MKNSDILASAKDQTYFNVILKVPPRLSKASSWETPCCWWWQSYMTQLVLEIRGIYLLSAQSWPCFRPCQGKSYGRFFWTDVKSLVAKFIRMKMIYWDFFMDGPFVSTKCCSSWGWFMVSPPGCCSVLVSAWLLLCAYSSGHAICCTLVFSSPSSTWGGTLCSHLPLPGNVSGFQILSRWDVSAVHI